MFVGANLFVCITESVVSMHSESLWSHRIFDFGQINGKDLSTTQDHLTLVHPIATLGGASGEECWSYISGLMWMSFDGILIIFIRVHKNFWGEMKPNNFRKIRI